MTESKWKITGDFEQIPGETDYIGTTNSQPLQFKESEPTAKEVIMKKIKQLEVDYRSKNPGCSDRNVKRYILRKIK